MTYNPDPNADAAAHTLAFQIEKESMLVHSLAGSARDHHFDEVGLRTPVPTPVNGAFQTLAALLGYWPAAQSPRVQDRTLFLAGLQDRWSPLVLV